MSCKNVVLKCDGSKMIIAYTAAPEGPGRFTGIVMIHHLPGRSEFHMETTRRFAHHVDIAICANLYERVGGGSPDDIAAKVRAEGGIADAQMVGDIAVAVVWIRAPCDSCRRHYTRLRKHRPRSGCTRRGRTDTGICECASRRTRPRRRRRRV